MKHFFFKSWPDYGVPPTTEPLINFCNMLRKERESLDGPVVVHCSAGVGRTGTFISTDIIMQQLQHEKKVNIHDLVKKLREQRVKMVQTVDQYIFLHKLTMNWIEPESTNQKTRWNGNEKLGFKLK